MNIDMSCLEIIGLKGDLQKAVRVLQRLGVMQIDHIRDVPQILARPLTVDKESLRLREQLAIQAAQIDGLIETLGVSELESPGAEEDLEAQVESGLKELVPQVQALTSTQDELEAELASLPRYEATLRQLLPIIPDSVRDPENISIGVLFSRAHIEVIDLVRKGILEITEGSAEIVTRNVDESTLAMLIVSRADQGSGIEALLEERDVTRLRLPSEFGSGAPDEVLAELQSRMAAIPREIEELGGELGKLADVWGAELEAWRKYVGDRLDAQAVLSRLGETDKTFILVGWVPKGEIEGVQRALTETVGEALMVQELPLTKELKKRAPVALDNPTPARPFETLIRLLALPRYGRIDPTKLIAIFLPIFFGMMLGDAGYGVLLLGLALWMMRKMKAGMMADFIKVLAVGAGWSIVFGILYGEAFGTLGEQLGMHAIWFERAAPEQVSRLLILTIAIGAGHITLGLILGVWEAIQEKSRSHLLERAGMLVGLVSLFMIVAVATNLLPDGFMTPAVVGLIIGIVLLAVPMGGLGILLGPIEFLGVIGNVLSYLRIAAIGLASVYLAEVANEMAGTLGNIIVGLIVAILIHALNLVMGAFSPTIHSLRLHYVEFFRKFYEGGGRAYRPFGTYRLSDTLQ